MRALWARPEHHSIKPQRNLPHSCQIVVGFAIAITQNTWLLTRIHLAKSGKVRIWGSSLLVIHLLAADDCGDGVVPYHYSLGCRECQPADLGNDTTCKDAKGCPDEALSCVKPD